MAAKVSARERARLAKAQRDAKRADHDKSVMETTQNFYKAEDEAESAREALDQAEQARAQAVLALSDLGERVEDVATLCGISASDVRALKKLARAAATTKDESATKATVSDSVTPTPQGDAA